MTDRFVANTAVPLFAGLFALCCLTPDVPADSAGPCLWAQAGARPASAEPLGGGLQKAPAADHPACVATATRGGRRWPATTAAGPVERSEQLELAARQADRHTQRGFQLAGRRAWFAARAEFILALRLVAEALDAEHQNTAHSRALAAGLEALQEADDFLPVGSCLEAHLDLAAIVATHDTPLFDPAGPLPITPGEAFRAYLCFAQEQLATAVGHEVAGSMALYGLGKLHAALATTQDAPVLGAEPKAMACYQAALLAVPNNPLAGNELGVLLARNGYYERARQILEHTARICRLPIVWHNLAVVYQRSGRHEQAAKAWQIAQRSTTGRDASGWQQQAPVDVQWVPPSEFARTARAAGPAQIRETATAAIGAAQPDQTPAPRTVGRQWFVPGLQMR